SERTKARSLPGGIRSSAPPGRTSSTGAGAEVRRTGSKRGPGWGSAGCSVSAELPSVLRRRFQEEKEGSETPSWAQNAAGRRPEAEKRSRRSTQSCRAAARGRGEGRGAVGATTDSDMSRYLQRFGRPLQGNQRVKDVIRRARTV